MKTIKIAFFSQLRTKAKVFKLFFQQLSQNVMQLACI